MARDAAAIEARLIAAATTEPTADGMAPREWLGRHEEAELPPQVGFDRRTGWPRWGWSRRTLLAMQSERVMVRTHDGASARLDARRVLVFLGVAFGFSWACWGVVILRGVDYLSAGALPFFVLGSFGPSVAALVVRVRTRTWTNPAVPGARRRWWPAALGAALLLGSVSTAVAVVGTATTHRPGLDLDAGRQALTSFGLPVVFLLVYLLLGPLSEEPGWRGWLYPQLRQHAGPGLCALGLGPLWTLWHLPLFLIPGTYQHQLGILTWGGLLFLLSTTGLSVLVAYGYERLGRLPAAIAVHYASNTVPAVLGLLSTAAAAWDAAAKLVVAVVLLTLWSPRRRPAPPGP